MLRSASFSQDRSNPEANAAGGMVLEVTISPSGAFMYGVAVVTTTTRGVLVAGRRSQRVNHCIVTVWTKPALTPLPDVSQHVIKTKGSRFFLTHGMSRTATVGVIPGDLVEIAVARRGGSGAGRVFPFGIGWKTAADGLAVVVGIVPTDQVVGFVIAVISLRVVVNHIRLSPLRLFGLAVPEPFVEG